jgi:hypothetical protein
MQESLSALFNMPLGVSMQLVMKHPPLASIPPNVTIAKAKGISLALGCSMQVTVILPEPLPLSTRF